MQALAFSLPQTGRGLTVAQAREAVIAAMEGTLQVACDSAAALAAEWYDEQARANHVKLDSAVTSTVYTRDALEDAVRYAAQHLVDGDIDGFAKVCGDYAADQARRSVNETIVRNAERDRGEGVRFARVPTGAETCAWCYMLATRGADYWSRESAGELNKYHHHCDCKVVQGYGAKRYDEIVEGWKPDEAYDRLKLIERQCGAKAGSDWKENDVVTRSMQLRDKDWLFYGIIPIIGYTNDDVRRKKYANSNERKQHALEIKTAEKLNALGFETVFQDDHPVINGMVAGLPDLRNGIEIKTVYQSASENTFSKHAGNSKKKRGLSALVIDAQAELLVSNSLKRHDMSDACLLKHDGTIRLITIK